MTYLYPKYIKAFRNSFKAAEMITAVGIPITDLFSDCLETPVNFIIIVIP